jgi:BNR repeat protein
MIINFYTGGIIMIGKTVHELIPKEGNPRNSEGSFITLDDGKLLYIYSSFKGDNGADDAPADLRAIISPDNGDTWGDPEIAVSSNEHDICNIMSTSLIRMKDTSIGLFYLVIQDTNDTRPYMRISTDEGKTWGKPKPCISTPGYYGIHNDRVVRLSDERLIAPVSFCRNGYNSKTLTEEEMDGRGDVFFYVSDDDGKTWYDSKSRCSISTHKHSKQGLQEPGLIELNNGVLWAWARTDLCYEYEMFSCDKGKTWTVPQPSRFTSPVSPLSMKRIPQYNYLLAVWNPIPNYNGWKDKEKAWTGGRTPLVMSVSKDEGTTWEQEITIENDPDSGFCYVAIHFVNDAVLLAYCAGGQDDGACLNRLRIKKINFSEFI